MLRQLSAVVTYCLLRKVSPRLSASFILVVEKNDREGNKLQSVGHGRAEWCKRFKILEAILWTANALLKVP